MIAHTKQKSIDSVSNMVKNTSTSTNMKKKNKVSYEEDIADEEVDNKKPH